MYIAGCVSHKKLDRACICTNPQALNFHLLSGSRSGGVVFFFWMWHFQNMASVVRTIEMIKISRAPADIPPIISAFFIIDLFEWLPSSAVMFSLTGPPSSPLSAC